VQVQTLLLLVFVFAAFLLRFLLVFFPASFPVVAAVVVFSEMRVSLEVFQ